MKSKDDRALAANGRSMVGRRAIALAVLGVCASLFASCGTADRDRSVAALASITSSPPDTAGPPSLHWPSPKGTPAPDSAEYRSDPEYWELVYVRDQIADDGGWFARVGLALKSWGPDRDAMTVWV